MSLYGLSANEYPRFLAAKMVPILAPIIILMINNSSGAILTILEFLKVQQVLRLQILSKRWYSSYVPQATYRQLIPSCIRGLTELMENTLVSEGKFKPDHDLLCTISTLSSAGPYLLVGNGYKNCALYEIKDSPVLKNFLNLHSSELSCVCLTGGDLIVGTCRG